MWLECLLEFLGSVFIYWEFEIVFTKLDYNGGRLYRDLSVLLFEQCTSPLSPSLSSLKIALFTENVYLERIHLLSGDYFPTENSFQKFFLEADFPTEMYLSAYSSASENRVSETSRSIAKSILFFSLYSIDKEFNIILKEWTELKLKQSYNGLKGRPWTRRRSALWVSIWDFFG